LFTDYHIPASGKELIESLYLKIVQKYTFYYSFGEFIIAYKNIIGSKARPKVK